MVIRLKEVGAVGVCPLASLCLKGEAESELAVGERRFGDCGLGRADPSLMHATPQRPQYQTFK